MKTCTKNKLELGKIFKVWCIIDETIFAPAAAAAAVQSSLRSSLLFKPRQHNRADVMSSSLYAIAFSNVMGMRTRAFPPNEYEKFVIFLKRKWRGATEYKKREIWARKWHNAQQRLDWAKDWTGSA
jgi:hypothetical protein